MDTKVTLPFADGEYTFWLPMPRVIAAEREMGRADADRVKQPRSIFAAFHDIAANLAQVDGETVLSGPSPALLADAQAIIRNGLIGGAAGVVEGESIAVSEPLARELVEVYCYPARAAIYDLGLAFQILRTAIYGIAPGSKKKDGEGSSPKPS